MERERHERLGELFLAALSLAGEARQAFLDRECGGDRELRGELGTMLEVYSRGTTAEIVLGRFAALPATELSAGAVVGGEYEVVAPLGSGGMGAVYRARQLATGREVALKVVRGRAATLTGRERFRREALTLGRLRHAHLVAVYDFGHCEKAGDYIAMELVSGRSLSTEIRERGRLQAKEAVRLMREICSGVQAAHEAGVVHRDLKPSNVMLEGEERVAKVLDFGIARPPEGDPGQAELTGTGALLGTPLYMAPETCEHRAVDERSDVYALGCIAYEMVAGRPPFHGHSVGELLVKHATAEPAPPSAAGADVGPALDAAILKALAKQPADRYASARAFSRALSEALAGRAPAPRAAEIARNLPQEVSSFVGRDEEAVEVARLAVAVPLLTLTGPGGIGKTRLALRVAGSLPESSPEDVADGVWFVDLAPLSDPSHVVSAVAASLSVREEPGRDLTALVCGAVKGRRLLVVLDNCEHVVEACATLVSSILRAAPGVRVLATSREPLGVEGERVVAVSGLSLEAGGGLSQAARLFEQRARLVKPAFAVAAHNAEAVERLCRELEGIPLAIELAAARVRVLTVQQILSRLGDRFGLLTGGGRSSGRQQTLRAAVDWSHDLLAEEERALLRRLAVFAGGFTLDAAESVVSGPLSVASEGSGATDNGQRTTDILDLLGSLIDKSFVTIDAAQEPPRYRMLETIRHYAGEKLAEAGEDGALRRGHAAWCGETVERAYEGMRAGEQAEWLGRLDLELENLREALRWNLRGGGDPANGLQMSARLCQYFYVRWRVTEGIEWIEEALARAPDAATNELAEALFAAGLLKGTATDYAGSLAYQERCLAIRRALGHEHEIACALANVADVEIALQGSARATAYLEEALEIFQRLGRPRGVGSVQDRLGRIAMEEGRFEEAEPLLLEALATAVAAGDKYAAAALLINLSEVSLGMGALEAAARHVEEASRLAAELDFKTPLVHVTIVRGVLAKAEGDLERGWALLGEALAEGLRLGDPESVKLALDETAALAAKRGEWVRALRLAGAAEAYRAARGQPLWSPFEARRFGEELRPAREALGTEASERALAEGRAMTPEQAAASVLAGESA